MAKRQQPKRNPLILDSGAVIALARGDQRARAFLAQAITLQAEIQIPVVVIAETLRGGPKDAPIHRILKKTHRGPSMDAELGQTAGHLLGRARSSDTIDALIVAQAVRSGGGHILTGDRGDLERLASGHPEVVIHPL